MGKSKQKQQSQVILVSKSCQAKIAEDFGTEEGKEEKGQHRAETAE